MGKINRFQRISIGLILVFIVAHIAIKAIIWPTGLLQPKLNLNCGYAIRSIPKNYLRVRYVTKKKQEIFDWANQLLTPAFILLFANIAVKLTKTPEIFTEQK